jgi:hypothetical protein
VIPAWLDDSTASLANRQAIAAQLAIDWLLEANRKSLKPDFRYAAGIAASWLERSQGLATARRIVAEACAPWFDGSAFA